MYNNNIEIEEIKLSLWERIINGIKRVLCLITPVIFAFLGYFLSPFFWELLNHNTNSPQWFSFLCSILCFILPTLFIFIDSRKLNPIIKITITDKKD